MNKRVGLFGGVFDPVHNGHLFLAGYLAGKLRLDKVMFVPTANPPHKHRMRSDKVRLEMLRLACRGNTKFAINCFEIVKKKCYTVDTIEWMVANNRGTQFFYLMGSDNVETFKTWKRWRDIQDMATVIAVTRPGYIQYKPEDLRISVLKAPCPDISSTNIRKLIGGGYSARYLVPERVWKYIRKNNTYKGVVHYGD